MILRRRPSTALQGWTLPSAQHNPLAPATQLGPHGGGASLWVDRNGWLAPGDSTISFDWRIRTGDGWESPARIRKSSQRLIGGASVETTVPTAVGSIVQRVAVGVVGGQPAGIVEIVNTASVAVAVAVGIRPFGRGSIAGSHQVRAGVDGIEVDGALVLSGNRPAASIVGPFDAAGEGALDSFDSLDSLDSLDSRADTAAVTIDGADEAAAMALTQGAPNAALIWPLPHTATLRFVIPLGSAVSPTAAVPGVDAIIRGWDRHLTDLARFSVEETEIAEAVPAVARDLACRLPMDGDVADWMIGLTELGLGREAAFGVPWLTAAENPRSVIQAIGRLVQLGFSGDWLDDALEPLARSASLVQRGRELGGARDGADAAGPVGWRASVVTAAAGAAREMDQPDVAAALDALASSAAGPAATGPFSANETATLMSQASPTWAWTDNASTHSLRQSARVAAALRDAFVRDDATTIHFLSELPVAWRGRAIEAHKVPTASGEASFGVRWHGSRPALLWEVHPIGDTPVTIRIPGLAPDWSTTDLSGETLLADPGWPAG